MNIPVSVSSTLGLRAGDTVLFEEITVLESDLIDAKTCEKRKVRRVVLLIPEV